MWHFFMLAQMRKASRRKTLQAPLSSTGEGLMQLRA